MLRASQCEGCMRVKRSGASVSVRVDERDGHRSRCGFVRGCARECIAVLQNKPRMPVCVYVRHTWCITRLSLPYVQYCSRTAHPAARDERWPAATRFRHAYASHAVCTPAPLWTPRTLHALLGSPVTLAVTRKRTRRPWARVSGSL